MSRTTIISELKAREIAIEWYNGQRSGLYKIVCNTDLSKLTASMWHEAYHEAVAIGRYDIDASRSTGLKLAKWIKYRARKYGYIADAFLTSEAQTSVIR